MIPDDPEQWRRLRALVTELFELAPAQRASRLATLPPELAAAAGELLAAADGESPDRLERGIAADAAWLLADWERHAADEAGGEPATLAGLELGPWRLQRLLGRGGMAEVWEAVRVAGDFEQVVAVKLLKRGMDSEEIVARFLRERQILARLDHPGIARLFDGGLAADGRPFFVLEKVDGEPITDWCEARHVGLAERLGLLVECCQAVAAAHRLLVVHRDLKPSNILVTADGTVKLLDFGIAKLLADDATTAEATRTELRLLTPAYAAPEQIVGEPVSTATDVYSLGVIAYQLLTGRLPHRRRGADLASAVSSEVVERPSTAVLTADDGTTALHREGIRERRRRARLLEGDLDTIVLTALRREPARRYLSVTALAEDLERFLTDRPVAARPDSLLYKSRKFVARHRLALAAATLAALSLITGVVVAVWQARRAEQAASAERVAATMARDEAARSQAIASFLTDVFTAADPEGRRAADLTARELVQRGVEQIDERLGRQPASRAAMLHVLGNVEYRLGLYEPAQALLEKALALRRALQPAMPTEVANSAAALGVLYHRQGRSDEGVKLLGEALALHEAAGPAARLDVAKDLNNLANAYRALARSPEARAAFERAIAILTSEADDPGQLARVLNNYGLFLDRAGEYPAARAALERALALHESTSGPDSALVSGTLGNLSELYIRLGEVDRAVAASRRALAISEQTYGPSHFETGMSNNSLGWALLAARRPAEARSVLERSLAILRAAIGEHHKTIGYSYRNLGQALAETGRPGEAIAALRRAESVWVATVGPDSSEIATVYVLLGPALVATGAQAEGERVLVRAVEIWRTGGANRLGEAWLALARARLARCHLRAAREALAAAQKEAAKHPDAPWAREAAPLAHEVDGARCSGAS